MSDDFDPALIGGLPQEDVVKELRGTRMLDIDSYQRIIESLKMAADAAYHLTERDPDWRKIAKVFDKLRSELAKLGGMATEVQDSAETMAKLSGETMGTHQAYDRVYTGLRGSAAAARQMATGHRGDLRWSAYATRLETLRDKCGALIRMKRQNAAPLLILPN